MQKLESEFTQQGSQPADTQGSPDRLTWTVEEAACRLGISRQCAYEAVRTRAIPSIKIGRRVLIPRAAFTRLLEQTTNNHTD
jgi:excisionase family DNA binding protein